MKIAQGVFSRSRNESLYNTCLNEAEDFLKDIDKSKSGILARTRWGNISVECTDDIYEVRVFDRIETFKSREDLKTYIAHSFSISF